MEELDLDLDLDPTSDLSLNTDLPSFAINDGPAVSSIPSTEGPSQKGDEDTGVTTHKPFYPKKPHRKSRAGCRQCKKRKVKCDEAKPACTACTLRKEKCEYPNSPGTSTGKSSPSPDRSSLAMRSRSTTPEASTFGGYGFEPTTVPVIAEPTFRPEDKDAIDMKMLWFYNTYAFQSFSVNTNFSQVTDYALKVKVIEHAFQSPFLMDTLMGLSALHLSSLGQPIPQHKSAAYQSRAFEGYRNAIEKANPDDFPALLGCSLFMIALSSQNFRGPNRKRLFIIEWIHIWRGIGLIVELVSPRSVQDSGIAVLFYRPPIDPDKSMEHIPNNLLFMVSSIKYGDDDYEHQKEYYDFLKILGSLYQELKQYGFGPLLNLRVITFFSFFPRVLLPLARQLRPRVLIIIAHWLCFVKCAAPGPWWMRGFMPTMDEIFEELGESWDHLLRVPKLIVNTEDKVKMARILIDNDDWTPGDVDLFKNRDPRIRNGLRLITVSGLP
ncbi:hypothetical protein GGR57DRAFT_83338 [Xylariaceae sp. FL1272]|nr:hypothetical protein GGR57DRAFT_83338 [Xylariaceae sp. FL1272]